MLQKCTFLFPKQWKSPNYQKMEINIKPSDLFGLERGKEGQQTKPNPQFPIPSQHSIEEARQRRENGGTYTNVFVKPDEQSKFTCTLPWRENEGIYTKVSMPMCQLSGVSTCISQWEQSKRRGKLLPSGRRKAKGSRHRGRAPVTLGHCPKAKRRQ